jgi:hypothetical protein
MKIFIGVPTHNSQIASLTALDLIDAATKTQHHIDFRLLGLSLLAKNFNILFCEAFNRGFDYLVIHHADIGACDPSGRCWLDTLLTQMQDHKLAALSAVVPIKTSSGVTSTALQLDTNNPYKLRRMTVSELAIWQQQRGRDTIITADELARLWHAQRQPGPLLINTGLLIMDLSAPWFDKRWPGFCIDDRLAWNSIGRPDSYTIPEDWNFSIWMHNNGLAYGATPSLEVSHVGQKLYESQGGWGDHTDLSQSQPSVEEYEQS